MHSNFEQRRRGKGVVAKRISEFRFINIFHLSNYCVLLWICILEPTRCLKKYCDCFNTGVKCTDRCRCIDCHNFEEYDDETPSSQKETPLMYTQTIQAQSQKIKKYEKSKELKNGDTVAMQLFPSKRYSTSSVSGPPAGDRFGLTGVPTVIKSESLDDSRTSTRTRRPSSRMEAV